MMNMKRFIGDKTFYRMVAAIAVPLILQTGISNFVNLLDNLMVGRIGTEQMSGVSIVNQLMFVFNLTIFGAMSAASIFGAQFFGKGDHEGQRNAFRIKVVLAAIIFSLGTLIFVLWDDQLISLYLHTSESAGDLALTLESGKAYLRILLIGLLPFSFTQVYSLTLRESGQTMIPMKASLMAVLVNLVFNYLLIFGKLGFPRLGVSGAAIATVMSRFVEAGIIIYWTHKRFEGHPFILGAYKTLRVPSNLALAVAKRGWPLMLNEALWGLGMATLSQCYSRRGLAVVAGINIASVISNLFNVSLLALGNCIGIIAGNLLGAGKMEEAKDTVYKMTALSFTVCIVVGGIMASVSGIFPQFYNTTAEVRELAQRFILIIAAFLPTHALMNAAYFTFRAGGKTFVTFLFDSGFTWLVSIPLAYMLVEYSSLPIVLIYLICTGSELIKCVIGLIMIKKDIWLNNIVSD